MVHAKNKPAIEGGTPIRGKFLPFYRPAISEDDVEYVASALRSGWLTLGPRTSEFESALNEYLGVKHTVTLSSCSEAMFLALKALGIGPGDEVITSSLTFASTVHSIIHAGATPVIVDIENDTFGPSPDEIEKKLSDKTRALLPVHYGGQACRIDEIIRLAQKKNLPVVEDAAHGFGASRHNRKLGSFGDATAFSFYATKNLTTGEGGCVTTDNAELAETIRKLSYHGMSRDSWSRYADKGSWYYEVEVSGYKSNFNDVLSSLGLSQLKKIKHLLEKRRQLAMRFTKGLEHSPFFQVPRTPDGNEHTWHLYVLRLNLETIKIDRDRFLQALTAENIGSSVHFIPIYKHPFYRMYARNDDQFPVCEDFYSRCMSLPIYAGMNEEEADDVVDALIKIASYYAK